MNVARDALVMAFYPNARGFAHVVFEGLTSPVDWGISEIPRKGRLDTCMRRLSALIERYRPDTVVFREMSGNAQTGMLAWLETAKALSAGKGIPSYALSRKEIRRTFSYLESPTRYTIAKAIAQEVPLFGSLMPPERKIWNGEDRRMGIFDAASLALSYMKQQSWPMKASPRK